SGCLPIHLCIPARMCLRLSNNERRKVTTLPTHIIPLFFPDDTDHSDDSDTSSIEREDNQESDHGDFVEQAHRDEILVMLLAQKALRRSPQETRIKSVDYWHAVFPSLQDDSMSNNFKNEFRLKRSTFNVIVARLAQHPLYTPSKFHQQTPVEIQVAV